MGLSQYRKYGRASEKLARSISTGVLPHAYIIEGDHNIDKEGFAKAFCQAIICRQALAEGCGRCVECRKIADENYEDLYIVRPEDTTRSKSGTTSVKDAQVDDLQADLKTKPTAGDRNIAIISGGDTMTMRAQTRILKTLEEPTEGTVIMILSENSENLLPTINSRCVNVRLYHVSGEDDTEMTGVASDIIEMIRKKEFFFDIASKLDENIKGRDDAYALIDAMEAQISKELRVGSVDRNDAKAKLQGGENAEARAVHFIEQTRSNIKAGASQKFMLRELMLELEETI